MAIPKKDFATYFELIPSMLPIFCVAIVLWTSLRWYWFRICDGTDETLSGLALVTGVLFVARSRFEYAQSPIAKKECSNWFLPALLTVIYTISLPLVPKAVLGILMVLIVGSVAKSAGALAKEKMVTTLAMLLLALPLTSSFNFYCRWPLQVFIAHGAGFTLGLYGFSLDVKGASILFEGKPIVIDAACSGLHFLWFSLYLGILIAYFRHASALRMVSTLVVSLSAALIANLVRVVILTFCFLIGLSGLANNSIFHQAVGVVAFLLIGCLIFLSFEIKFKPVFSQLQSAITSIDPASIGLPQNNLQISKFSFCIVCLVSAFITATLGHDSFAARTVQECCARPIRGAQISATFVVST